MEAVDQGDRDSLRQAERIRRRHSRATAEHARFRPALDEARYQARQSGHLRSGTVRSLIAAKVARQGMPAALSFEDVNKTFGTGIAVDRATFEVGANEFVSIVGPSGCGKSTLLRL